MTHDVGEHDDASVPPWSAAKVEEELAFLAMATVRKENTTLDWLNLHAEVRNIADLSMATAAQRARFDAYASLIATMQPADSDADR